MTPLELASTHDIRVWPGGFVIYQYTEKSIAHIIKAPWSQAHLVKALEEMNLEQGATVIYATRSGGTPLPVAHYSAAERRLRSMTPNQGTSAGAATVTGDYRRLVAGELERIADLATQHPDSAFAIHFLDTIATARKCHPFAHVNVAHIADGEVAHQLEQRLLRLKRGFELYILPDTSTVTIVRNADGSQTYTYPDSEAIYTTLSNPDGTVDFEYANTQTGADWRAWDTLALEVYHLAQRTAPTPLMWHRVLEPWFTSATLLKAAREGTI